LKDERAFLAEAIMWDYELDFMPDGMEIVDRQDLLMWKRPTGPFAQRRWSNRVSYVRTTSDQVDRTIDEAFAFFGPVAFTWVVGPTSRPLDLSARLVTRDLVDVGDGDLLTAALPISGLRGNAELKIVEVDDEATTLIGLRLAIRMRMRTKWPCSCGIDSPIYGIRVAVAGTSSLFSEDKRSPTRATATPQITRPCI
jgi:hypothetical protein